MIAQELMAHLIEEELVEDQPLPGLEPSTPWYIQLISALGAWLASFFLLLFWLFTGSQHGSVWVIEGLGQAAMAVVLLRTSRSPLIEQPSLALWVTGSGLASVGVAMLSSPRTGMHFEPWWAIVTLLALTPVYPHFLGRLVSLMGAGWWLLVAAAEWRDGTSSDVALILLAVAGGATWLGQEQLWKRGPFWGELVRPFGLAAYVLLFEMLIVSHWRIFGTPTTWATSAVLVCMVLWLVARIIPKLQLSLGQGAWALGAVLAVGAVTFSVPGIMAAIGVLLVAYCVRERTLTVLALGFLLLFFGAWYADLALSWPDKSLILLALGGVLLALRKGLVAAP